MHLCIEIYTMYIHTHAYVYICIYTCVGAVVHVYVCVFARAHFHLLTYIPFFYWYSIEIHQSDKD